MCTLCIVSKKWPCVHSVAALVRLLLQEEGTAYLQRQGWETEKATVLRLLSIYSVSLWDTFLMGKNFFYFFPTKRDSIFTGCPDKFVICMRKVMYVLKVRNICERSELRLQKKCVFAANSCVLSIFFQLQNEDGFLKTTFLLFTTVLSLL